jgi:hypothetical protein
MKHILKGRIEISGSRVGNYQCAALRVAVLGNLRSLPKRW